MRRGNHAGEAAKPTLVVNTSLRAPGFRTSPPSQKPAITDRYVGTKKLSLCDPHLKR